MNTETQNYKIIVAYDGTRYKGWQVQKSTDDTIQGKLQHVLSTLAGKPVLYYALKAFEESDITDIILVTGADEEAYCKRKIIDKYHIGK